MERTAFEAQSNLESGPSFTIDNEYLQGHADFRRFKGNQQRMAQFLERKEDDSRKRLDREAGESGLFGSSELSQLAHALQEKCVASARV